MEEGDHCPLCRKGAVRRGTVEEHCREPGVDEELIVPSVVNGEQIRLERMKSIKQSNFLTTLTLPSSNCDIDKRTVSIRRAQEGMRPEERKALIKDDFAYIFYKLAGEDELLDAFELQRFMSMVYKHKYKRASDFNIETCRSMVASVEDREIGTRTGKITFHQFKKLWMRLMKWAHIFHTSDADEDGNINQSELSVALEKLGVQFKEEYVRMLMNKFKNRENVIELDDFILICCKANSAKCSFNHGCHGRIKEGSATLDGFLLEIINI